MPNSLQQLAYSPAHGGAPYGLLRWHQRKRQEAESELQRELRREVREKNVALVTLTARADSDAAVASRDLAALRKELEETKGIGSHTLREAEEKLAK